MANHQLMTVKYKHVEADSLYELNDRVQGMLEILLAEHDIIAVAHTTQGVPGERTTRQKWFGTIYYRPRQIIFTSSVNP